MRFSIVVPTYNEEKDIAATLDSLIQIDWPDYEILVVDDSSDNTPAIVRSYESKGVRLIIPARREGRCGARNLGILSSSGEVVVILNADVRLPKDFFQRIGPHYEQGFDFVLVTSIVENQDAFLARYVEYAGRVLYYNRNPELMDWTEGFSCRRHIAIQAGLFPTGYPIPICAGEDGVFGENLVKLKARKKVDLNTVVTHVAPATLSEYWQIRIGRGKGSPHVRRFIQKWSFPKIILRAALRTIKSAVLCGLVLPSFIICTKFARVSPRGFVDVFPFGIAWIIEQLAFSWGEWKSIIEIYRAESRISKSMPIERVVP